ncbi:MAG: AIR synthase-related protein [Patescibacteria group bacterium]
MYKTRIGDDPRATQLLRQLQRVGYPDLRGVCIEDVLCIEGDHLDKGIRDEIVRLFCNPVVEKVSFQSKLLEVREVRYQRAITDPEWSSLKHAIDALGLKGIQWVRLSTRYKLVGVDKEAEQEITSRWLYNPQVQTIIAPGVEWSTLMPQGQTGGVSEYDISHMNLAEMKHLSKNRRLFLSPKQLLAIHSFFKKEGRIIRDAELEMVAAAWGDHCSHTTLRALGLLECIQEATRRINHPLVVSCFKDNAGVMRFYGGWAINFKGETHISPTFAGSPYGGIMTKHGGVIRDVIFTGQGGWPFAGTTIMGICDPRMPWEQLPKGAIHPRTVLLESIRGTGQYTNPMGIPMAWSQYMIHSNNVKGFALGHSIGIIPESRAQKGEPQPGDFVVLIGGDTGIDGIHGATVSSAASTHETTTVDAAHVQIGMPIEERKCMEVIPILRDAGCIRACTDCGAAGLSSAVGEMGEGTGVWINLAWVPLKCVSMLPWQVWLSESQERGVLCIPPAKLAEAMGILTDYGVPATAIGIFTDTKRCQVIYNAELNHTQWLSDPIPAMDGMIVVDLPYSFLTGYSPLPDIQVKEPMHQDKPFFPPVPDSETQWIDLIQRHLGHFNLSDQSGAAHQYDQTVQGNTVMTYMGGKGERMPDELFVTTPVRGRRWACGIANAVNQFYGDIDPAGLGKLMMAQAVTKLVAAGFRIDNITYCANLYTPSVLDSPENAWKLVQLVKHGYVPASEELRVPVITGKDSSSGTFFGKNGERIDAPLTLDVLAVGRLINAFQLIPKAFAKPGDQLVLYTPGLKKINLGGSVLLDLFGARGDALPEVDLLKLRSGLTRYHRMLTRLQWQKQIHSRSAVAEGGLIRRLFEMSIGSGLGCTISLESDPLLWMFGELNGAILFASSNGNWRDFLSNGNCHLLGEVSDVPIIEVNHRSKQLFRCPTDLLATQWLNTFKEVVL